MSNYPNKTRREICEIGKEAREKREILEQLQNPLFCDEYADVII